MKDRKFNKIINSCVNKKTKLLDINKIKKLDDETKEKITKYLVRNRGPIIQEFIVDTIDKEWLECCGYLYTTKGKNFTFVHTSEYKIV